MFSKFAVAAAFAVEAANCQGWKNFEKPSNRGGYGDIEVKSDLEIEDTDDFEVKEDLGKGYGGGNSFGISANSYDIGSSFGPSANHYGGRYEGSSFGRDYGSSFNSNKFGPKKFGGWGNRSFGSGFGSRSWDKFGGDDYGSRYSNSFSKRDFDFNAGGGYGRRSYAPKNSIGYGNGYAKFSSGIDSMVGKYGASLGSRTSKFGSGIESRIAGYGARIGKRRHSSFAPHKKYGPFEYRQPHVKYNAYEPKGAFQTKGPKPDLNIYSAKLSTKSYGGDLKARGAKIGNSVSQAQMQVYSPKLDFHTPTVSISNDQVWAEGPQNHFSKA